MRHGSGHLFVPPRHAMHSEFETSMDFTLNEERRAVVELADELGRTTFAPVAERWDRERRYPHENVERLREEGLLGMTIPKRFGGGGRPLLDVVLAIEQVSKYCATTGRILVETNMGTLGVVMAYGTDEQRELIAERILEDGDKPTIGMTEPGAGTDLRSLETTATRAGDAYVIDGIKHWITGGGLAETNLVFARIREEDGSDHGIGAVLVDRSTPGFEVLDRERQLGVRGMPEATLRFDNCEVPVENLVLRDRENGFKRLMQAYNAQRVGASAVALGIAQGAHDLAVEYMLDREQFDRPIAEFQGLRWRMAESEMELHAARLLVHRAAAAAAIHPNNAMFPDMHEAAIAKAYTADAAFEVVNESLQMFGAMGYGDRTPLERMLRDVRMFKIGGGTTEAQRNVIAKTVFDSAEARKDPLLDRFDPIDEG